MWGRSQPTLHPPAKALFYVVLCVLGFRIFAVNHFEVWIGQSIEGRYVEICKRLQTKNIIIALLSGCVCASDCLGRYIWYVLMHHYISCITIYRAFWYIAILSCIIIHHAIWWITIYIMRLVHHYVIMHHYRSCYLVHH